MGFEETFGESREVRDIGRSRRGTSKTLYTKVTWN